MNKMEPLTRKELLAVLRAARESSVRDHCMFLLSFAHGLRCSEAAQLRMADLNTKDTDWTLRIARKKRSKTTTQIVSPNSERLLDERKALRAWFDERRNVGPYLFSKPNGGCLTRIQVYRLFRQYAEAAGLPASKRAPHSLKHALGQSMADMKIDIARVQQALGHASINSTIHYFTISDRQADEARQTALMSS
jgi:integrase